MSMSTVTGKDSTGATKTMLAASNGSGHLAAATTWVDENGVYVSADPFGIRVGNGEITGYTVVDKFGHNANIGSTMAPIAHGGSWETPQISGASTMRVKAGNANDTAAGSGAQSIMVVGTDITGAAVSEVLVTNGASAGAAGVVSFHRVYTAYVVDSGTYATASASSHAAEIVIENSAGGTDWAAIPFNGLAHGRSQIAAFVIPLGKKAYITSMSVHVDSTKTPDVFFFSRGGILKTSAPYEPRMVVRGYTGVEGNLGQLISEPIGPYPALTDMGFMASVGTGSAAISAKMTILLMDE